MLSAAGRFTELGKIRAHFPISEKGQLKITSPFRYGGSIKVGMYLAF